jgi:hypothetical protein
MTVFSLALLVVAAHASAVCKKDFELLDTLLPSYYTWWTCDRLPSPTRMMYRLENPNGHLLTVSLVDGSSDCASNDLGLGAKPEASYFNLALTGLYMYGGQCQRAPCCLKVMCDNVNPQSCSNIQLSFEFFNDLPDSDGVNAAQQMEPGVGVGNT